VILHQCGFRTPIGEMVLVTSGRGLCALEYADEWERAQAGLQRRFGTLELKGCKSLRQVTSRMQRYFDGELGALAGIEVDLDGTPFQLAVWNELRNIPAGKSISYAMLASRIGRPGAARAVGSANRRNPIALVVPCHRVIGATGELRGYAGGLNRKKWLLDHELSASAHRPAPWRAERADSLFAVLRKVAP
jgi:methylated-DNA-[protein]-cysteine S-methyltransferase